MVPHFSKTLPLILSHSVLRSVRHAGSPPHSLRRSFRHFNCAWYAAHSSAFVWSGFWSRNAGRVGLSKSALPGSGQSMSP